MTKSLLIEHLRNLSNENIHIKVFLNQTKIIDYLVSNVSLRKLIRSFELEKLQLYKLNLFYKNNGEYYLSDLKNLFLVVDAQNKLVILEPIKICPTDKQSMYLRVCGDYLLQGQSTKKIMIDKTDFKLYDIHVCAVHSEKSVAQQRIYDFNTSIILASNSKNRINIKKEVDKKLNKFIFDFNKIICSDDCIIGQDGIVIQSESTNKIYIETLIERKKGLFERIFNFVKKDCLQNGTE